MNTRLAFRRSATPSIEILESRVAPAGLVTATFAGGILTLTGDNLDNTVTFQPVGQSVFQLIGSNGTTIALNGAAAAAIAVLDGDVTSLKAQMGLGNDFLAFQLVEVTGSVSVDGGAGNDSFSTSNS